MFLPCFCGVLYVVVVYYVAVACGFAVVVYGAIAAGVAGVVVVVGVVATVAVVVALAVGVVVCVVVVVARVMPRSELTFGSTAFKAIPVLGINLSGNTTVESAIVTVNKNLVEIAGSNVQIYPQLNWIPQDDEVKNAVYISQRPAYSSVSTGGLEFTLFECLNV